MANYNELLKKPQWQKKRLNIFNRDKFACTICKDTESELHVHHLKYTGKPWDAKDEDLTTLCCDCHLYVSKNEHKTFSSVYSDVHCKVYDIDGRIFIHDNESKSVIVCFQKNSVALGEIVKYINSNKNG